MAEGKNLEPDEDEHQDESEISSGCSYPMFFLLAFALLGLIAIWGLIGMNRNPLS